MVMGVLAALRTAAFIVPLGWFVGKGDTIPLDPLNQKSVDRV